MRIVAVSNDSVRGPAASSIFTFIFTRGLQSGNCIRRRARHARLMALDYRWSTISFHSHRMHADEPRTRAGHAAADAESGKKIRWLGDRDKTTTRRVYDEVQLLQPCHLHAWAGFIK